MSTPPSGSGRSRAPSVDVAAATPHRAALEALLALAGWRTTSAGSPARRGSARAEVGLVLLTPDAGPPESWTRAGLPHVALALHGDRARVGPFVAPGLTPCVRCVQSHDPLAGGAPAGLALLAVAVGWALLDLESWLAGETPATWSGTTLSLDARGVVDRRVWPRHPHCGCSWGLAG